MGKVHEIKIQIVKQKLLVTLRASIDPYAPEEVLLRINEEIANVADSNRLGIAGFLL